MKLVLKKLRMERLSSSGKAGFGLGVWFGLVCFFPQLALKKQIYEMEWVSEAGNFVY